MQVLNYLINYGNNLLESHKYNGINTTFDIIQMTIDEAIEANPDDYQKFLLSWLQAAIILGITWGLGGLLDEDSRKEFDHFHKKVHRYREFTSKSMILLLTDNS